MKVQITKPRASKKGAKDVKVQFYEVGDTVDLGDDVTEVPASLKGKCSVVKEAETETATKAKTTTKAAAK